MNLSVITGLIWQAVIYKFKSANAAAVAVVIVAVCLL